MWITWPINTMSEHFSTLTFMSKDIRILFIALIVTIACQKQVKIWIAKQASKDTHQVINKDLYTYLYLYILGYKKTEEVYFYNSILQIF